MAKTKQEIITEIKSYISTRGGEFSSWFVGVTNDATARLLHQHKVDQRKDSWVFRTADSAATAKEIEDYFVKVLGAEGGASTGTETADKVYAYKKSERTIP
ncbi:MAG TPA: hypothetical protein DGH68_09075 [Bacteroidetes bacterium]|jgi:hypothetical protein|nr:hypothetical protein [Bacteroidota bacterium]